MITVSQQEKMRGLIDELNRASYAYYTKSESVMSDAQWDSLYNELLALENETGVRMDDSPTKNVGSKPLAGFEKYTHLSRLWSMDKAQNEGELLQWFVRTQKLHDQNDALPPLSYAIEYKFDGLTLNLTYRNGDLVQAATRGNGIVGESILPQAMTIDNVPHHIPYKGLMEVQGECIMRLSALEKYNKAAKEPLKNARNAAAGALRNLDPEVTRSRHLSAFFYQIGTIENPPYQDQEGMIAFIRENGLPVSDFFRKADSMEAAMEAVREIEASRDTLDFLIDGAVIKVRDEQTRRFFGYTDKFPRWAVAFKFAAEENTTILRKVTWELGRTGKLTPLAHVEAVDFAGVTVRKATLNNWGDILRKNLAIGKSVWIRRSNDVIPEIMGCVDDAEEGKPIEKPDQCPSCGEALVERGANLFCVNRTSCRPQAVARIAHFSSRDAMNIMAFSEKTAEVLYDCCGVRDPADLYHLTKEQLLTLDGFGETKAQNLLDALEKSRHCALDAFLFALGIPNIGRRTARDLAKHFKTLEAVRSATVEELTALDDVGEIVAQSVTEFFSYPEDRQMVDRLLSAGVEPQAAEEKISENAILGGKTVVVTGTLPTLSRKDAEDMIRAFGGTASGSVSKKTAFVLCGENPGSKLEKAQKLGIPVYDENEFLALLHSN